MKMSVGTVEAPNLQEALQFIAENNAYSHENKRNTSNVYATESVIAVLEDEALCAEFLDNALPED